ncbi:MAG: 4Fe-4S dicluster domain-containing protein, partial [candidate division Zixibacteria bacterium]|nr:4Fe-4S dicluster domain-containing protein [candidate division Zixibacteria bacterium]
MSTSRRKFLGWLTAFGTAVAVPKKTSAEDNQPADFGILHDTTLCIGCRSCEDACYKVNDLAEPETPFADRSILDQIRRPDDKQFTVVNKYIDNRSLGALLFRKTQCNHCIDPACKSVCFVNAFSKTKEGAVIYDSSVCVGCRYCLLACPFEILAYEYNKPREPKVMKCTMCQPRIEDGLLPGCAQNCPMEALKFGRRLEMIEYARERIRRFPDRYIDHIYGEHEMGGTNWLYISGVPFEELGLRTDLGTTPASEFTSTALNLIPYIAGILPLLLGGVYTLTKRKEKGQS